MTRIVVGAFFMMVGALPFFLRPRPAASSYAVARARFIGFLFAGFGLFLATHGLLAMVGGAVAVGIGLALMALGVAPFRLWRGVNPASPWLLRARLAGAGSLIVGLFAAVYGLLVIARLLSPPGL